MQSHLLESDFKPHFRSLHTEPFPFRIPGACGQEYVHFIFTVMTKVTFIPHVSGQHKGFLVIPFPLSRFPQKVRKVRYNTKASIPRGKKNLHLHLKDNIRSH